MMKRVIKKISVIILVACIVLLTVTFNCMAESRFADMSGHWAEKYVEILAERGVISGMADGLFHPNLPITTSQFVTMLIVTHVGKIDPINDYWASGYIDHAYKVGIIDESDIERAEEPLDRRFVARIGHDMLLKVIGEEDEEDWSSAESLRDLYSCRTCVVPVAQMYVKGIMLGRPDGFFHGEDKLTRAEAAIIVMKMLDTGLREPQGAATSLSKSFDSGTILPEVAKSIIESDENALLIDVRSQEEYNTGYIPKSICIPLDEIIENLETAMPQNKDTIIILYCQKGSRSLKAYEILKEAGYTNVYSMGGIDDWPYEIITYDN